MWRCSACSSDIDSVSWTCPYCDATFINYHIAKRKEVAGIIAGLAAVVGLLTGLIWPSLFGSLGDKRAAAAFAGLLLAPLVTYPTVYMLLSILALRAGLILFLLLLVGGLLGWIFQQHFFAEELPTVLGVMAGAGGLALVGYPLTRAILWLRSD
jgi:hypothetical protein